MKLMQIGPIFTTLLVWSTCTKIEPLNEFTVGNWQFTGRLYNEILKDKPNQNFIFSPFSIEVVMALTRAGAKGGTLLEFASALNLPSQEETEAALKNLFPLFKQTSGDYQLSLANKLFLKDDFPIMDNFKKRAVENYQADIENIDFAKNVEATQKINQWVEEHTNNKIKNVVNSDNINDFTKLLLVNALHFKGSWEYQFSPTIKETFYITKTNTKKVDMMSIEETFKYYESPALKAKFLELPYHGSNITMTIVLPDDIDGLAALEKNIYPLLKPQDMEYQLVSATLPSFLIESEYDLKPILERLGLKNVFSDSADLSGISSVPLKVSGVVQKAFINVTRSGTEAAAATVVEVALGAALIPDTAKGFLADHPFIYYMKFRDVVLFFGRISHF